MKKTLIVIMLSTVLFSNANAAEPVAAVSTDDNVSQEVGGVLASVVGCAGIGAIAGPAGAAVGAVVGAALALMPSVSGASAVAVVGLAAIGSIAGPVGTVVGAAAGAALIADTGI